MWALCKWSTELLGVHGSRQLLEERAGTGRREMPSATAPVLILAADPSSQQLGGVAARTCGSLEMCAPMYWLTEPPTLVISFLQTSGVCH